MKKYSCYAGMLILLLLTISACTVIKRDSAGKPVGDPTGRIFNPELSCVGHCTGYAASGNDWCFCDAPCSKNGNCCSDIETACPDVAIGKPTEAEGKVYNPSYSCVGHCTGYATSGNEWCFCDKPCSKNGNCCADFKTACPELMS